ncbi:serine/threonine-protein kinase ATM isoform X1 [Cucumis melo var. makuwa]|uniref:Serine/threonine-protein kinase ATM isoform X1 n=1 Tax=Cucumis melo var. makuwa TaxID=1194695 RepID=A0A5A7UPR7_CUCMM|nr:serine/threonine-protein kinase ATM isoform X1 [Cucumis melo var. makuwa]
MITSRDVQDIISKLSSDKAKTREEGIKLLNTWLEGEKAIDFCKFIGQNTAKLKPEEIPSPETWPFITKLLIQCVSMEISSSKRRLPKLMFAKTLRAVVQKAEANKFSGNALPLISVVKVLFSHVWDVLSTTPCFQSEYGIIIRHLVAVRDYRFHLRKRIYCNLMLLYLEKVEGSLVGKNDNLYTPKEELFRCILTLHSLLENPPGDFPDSIRQEIVNGIVKIFSLVRDEGKVSRKLIECVNTYLLKDGSNLGSSLLEIHNSVQTFVFRCWMVTHDRALKDALVLYGRLQISLTRGADDESVLIEQLLDVLYKELDQSSIFSVGVPWSNFHRSDANKDDKFGTLSSSHCGLVELAAAVLYRACVTSTKAISTEKRVKRDPASVHLKEALGEGKWLWNAAFCCLIQNYHSRISKDLFTYWFEAICLGFERILKDANVGHSYDGLLWTLRSLQELSGVLLDSTERSESSSEDKLYQGWQSIWSCLMHGLPMFTHVFVVAEAALLLLGKIIERDSMKMCVIPQDVWEHLFFKRMPSISALYLISCYFSRKGSQGDLRDIFHLRKNLLRAVLGLLNLKEVASFNEQLIFLLPAAVYALCAGCAPSRDVTGVLDECLKKDVKETYLDWSQEIFECSVEIVAKIHLGSSVKICPTRGHKAIHLPRQIRDPLLEEMETTVLGALIDMEREKLLPSSIFILCALLANFIDGSTLIRQWEKASLFTSRLGRYILEMMNHAVNVIQGYCRDIKHLNFFGSDSFLDTTSSVVTSFRSFASSFIFNMETCHKAPDVDLSGAFNLSMENLLKALSQLYQEYSISNKNLHSEANSRDFDAPVSPLANSPLADAEVSRILDMELDVNNDSNDMDTKRSMTPGMLSATVWKLRMISLISSFSSVLLESTWEVLFVLLENECDSKVCEQIMYHLSQNILWSSSEKVLNMMMVMDNMISTKVNLKLDLSSTLDAVGGLLRNLSSFHGVSKIGGRFTKDAQFEKNLLQIGKVVNRIAETDLLDWSGRVKLIDCICNFILISPEIGQTMIERLFVMLRDPEYRVRYSLAKQMGVLFQTWDGHEELFQDICSSFGVPLVLCSKQKVVTAKEVLDAGLELGPTMETIIVTVGHLALHSDAMELEAVFMLCAISAIDPSQREMVSAMLDNLSRELNYSGRQKYLEELMGSLLFCWVTCGVSLTALIEIRQLFVLDSEPSYFIQYCCHWLLPAVILHGDSSNLGWIASEPLCDYINKPLARGYVRDAAATTIQSVFDKVFVSLHMFGSVMLD